MSHLVPLQKLHDEFFTCEHLTILKAFFYFFDKCMALLGAATTSDTGRRYHAYAQSGYTKVQIGSLKTVVALALASCASEHQSPHTAFRHRDR